MGFKYRRSTLTFYPSLLVISLPASANVQTEDLRKIHAEITQIANQRFVLSTLAISALGGAAVWLTQGVVTSDKEIGVPIFLKSTLLILFLLMLFFLSQALKTTLRLYTTYLRVTRKSEWESDWKRYRTEFVHSGYSKPQGWLFLFLGLAVFLYPYLLALIYDMRWAPRIAFSIHVVIFGFYVLLVLAFAFERIGMIESHAQSNWEQVLSNKEPMNSETQLPSYSPLDLSETYRHFNTLIWQVPSWGIAIAGGVVVAANQVGKDASDWQIERRFVQASILLFGSLLLSALTIAHYRYRAYQAASAPCPVRTPPFRQKPEANMYLQGALCVTSGGLAGLAAVQTFKNLKSLIIGLVLGLVAWAWAEICNKAVVRRIRNHRADAEAKTANARPT